ncbi:hypothetical protein, partial [Streptomyces sp. NPDC002640]
SFPTLSDRFRSDFLGAFQFQHHFRGAFPFRRIRLYQSFFLFDHRSRLMPERRSRMKISKI